MRRCICSFLIGILILVFPFSVSAFGWREVVFPPEQYTMMGDVNVDKKVNSIDALRVLQYSVSKYDMFLPGNATPEETLRYEQFQYYKTVMKLVGDVTGDGYVNSQDALHILQYAVGKRDAFENNDLSGLQDLVYPELVPTTPTDVTPTDK